MREGAVRSEAVPVHVCAHAQPLTDYWTL